LKPEVAYKWTYGVVWTPAKVIRGLTLSADLYHIDLRNATLGRDANTILGNNWSGSTGTLPNGAPMGGPFRPDSARSGYWSGAERKCCPPEREPLGFLQTIASPPLPTSLPAQAQIENVQKIREYPRPTTFFSYIPVF
jgi:hypothetical protein